ncbi:hypothetical protein B0T14DRAFT_569102 [Immersiella caudata]|uniref:Uncharacterized protein n=1 Tax=Immersiella caudata TaxID=314043 RepID=A0AA39WLI6_9PEZI|nr:hypothetical protein B0T14DRAFT_569102 [Immersiella caudata]
MEQPAKRRRTENGWQPAGDLSPQQSDERSPELSDLTANLQLPEAGENEDPADTASSHPVSHTVRLTLPPSESNDFLDLKQDMSHDAQEPPDPTAEAGIARLVAGVPVTPEAIMATLQAMMARAAYAQQPSVKLTWKSVSEEEYQAPIKTNKERIAQSQPPAVEGVGENAEMIKENSEVDEAATFPMVEKETAC